MPWDIEIEVAAPPGRLFSTIAAWHEHEKLLQLASVEKYQVLSSDGRTEYFALDVRDLPFKHTYCYGKRLMRRPSAVVTIFTYRYFRSESLADPAGLERLMDTEWESFFYQTVRLSRLAADRSRLMVTEPGGDPEAGTPLNDIREFYAELGRIAEEPEGPQPLPEEDRGSEEDVFFWPVSEGEYNPHAILGIKCGAPFQSVKRAYRTLALKWHPDKLASRGPALKEYAHNTFIEITAAYHTILRMRGL